MNLYRVKVKREICSCAYVPANSKQEAGKKLLKADNLAVKFPLVNNHQLSYEVIKVQRVPYKLIDKEED